MSPADGMDAIVSHFDDLLPPKSKVDFLEAIGFVYHLGGTIRQTLRRLERGDRAEFCEELPDYFAKRCRLVKWRRVHAVPKGGASDWIAGQLTIVVRDVSIELGIHVGE